ncbi:IS21 family transposase [Desulfogranum marinum]|uniref:IS21 family transposase n=1 Tax=Desulfogranum marinum TaxID=453220 RepID=UPI0029C9A209|nr:IS21 family transposase [Desulfogranum marinum]
MISYEQFCQIKHYREEGLKAGQIAAKIDLDTRTVRKWMERDAFQLRLPGNRPSKLDPYKDSIISMLERHPYTARQVFQQISEQGFDGGYTIVKDYVRKVRAKREKAYLKLAFAPGECAQVDWGSYKSVAVGSTRRRLSFFVMVLCYSRMMYVEFTVSQTMEHFLGCHQRALEYFGRVPAKIMVDNLKSAVLRRTPGFEPVFNPKYLNFANHYGFHIVPCAVGKGNEKGIVENAVGYVKKNFLAGLEPGEFKIMNPAVENWLATIANVRTHGETRKQPKEMLRDELASLLPLPSMPYDIARVLQVRASRQFRVTLDSNRYSVPAEYAGVGLTMKVYPDRICIYHDNTLVARHTRSYDRYQDLEDPDHPKALLQQRRKAKDQKAMQRFLTLSAKAELYYQGLRERKLNLMHHIRQIVGLSDIYGEEEVARVLEDALEFQAFSCEYIANLLEQRKHINAPPGALHLTRSEDLLEIELKEPDISIYAKRGNHEEQTAKG